MKRIINHKQGFTLMELLVVMAISIILLGLIMMPIYQSFSLTRRAEAMVDAQDSARTMMAQITRDIGQAIFVFDNTSQPISLPVRQQDGSIENFTLPYGKIDIQMPRMVAYCKNPDHPVGQPRDFSRDDGHGNVYAQPECPVCGSTNVEIRPKLPLQQDTKIVRYFLALKKNDATLGWRSSESDNKSPGDDNPVILYRAEFDPRDDSLFAAGVSVSDRLNDPNFFYNPTFAEKWAQVAKPIGIARHQDLVTGTYQSPDSHIVAVAPTVSFKFAKKDNDNMAGTYTTDKSFDYPNTVPTVHRATHGYWAPGSSVTVFRNDYTEAYTLKAPTNPTAPWIIKKQIYNGTSWDTPVDVFNITEYVQNGNVVSMNSSPLEMAFTVNMNKGIVDFGIYPQKKDVNDSSISPLDPITLNDNFQSTYLNDPGSASRGAYLSTFDSTSPNYLANARIVPGSEVVVGADYYDGSHSRSRRYERVPYGLGDPGPNQYKIDYDTGWIEFSPVPEQNIPEWELIDVDYKVYFNHVDDVVSGSYTTKALITVQLGIRVFDPESTKPHLITISDNVVVGNALR